jgi:DnaK suppressor protein
MSKNSNADNADFLAAQKKTLLKLRDELQGELDGLGKQNAEEQSINAEAREYEDDAQKLDTLERDGVQERRITARLDSVNQALTRIDEGNYGISTVSGKQISQARLEAVPEALWNVGEEPAGA